MDEYEVEIPEETYTVVRFLQEERPGVAVVNTGLRGFEPRVVFGWHLSLVLDFEDLAENGMPSRAEREVVDLFGDSLDGAIRGDDTERPNALFLARITWNETRELIWRVFDPEVVNDYLQAVVDAGSHARPFDYRMEHDPEWRLTEWHLRPRSDGEPTSE